jgi:hypothetical protein
MTNWGIVVERSLKETGGYENEIFLLLLTCFAILSVLGD